MGRTVALVSTTMLTATAAIALVPSATVQAAPPRVVINELHYHPADDDPAAEFIELLNTTGRPIGLAGWCIDGIDFCFRGGTIGSNGYAVVSGAQYPGKLSNGGEDITLSDANGAVVDFVEYDDKREWPALADGEGDSLQRRDPASPSESPGTYRIT